MPIIAATKEQFADYLTSGFWSDIGWSIPDWGGKTTFTYNVSGFDASDALGIDRAFAQWSDVANISFVKLTTGNGDINITDTLYSASTSFYNNGFNVTGGIVDEVRIVLDTTSGFFGTDAGDFGNYAYITAIHEIGHSLGLGHSGDYNGSANYQTDAIWTNDTRQYSVMSYFNAENSGADHTNGAVREYSSTPALFDIYAIQQIFGANLDTRTGNTAYGTGSFGLYGGYEEADREEFNFNVNTSPVVTIWDSAGIDIINIASASDGQILNLNEGSFSSLSGLTNNVAIAYGTIIENARGAQGDDTIIGNEYDNEIEGMQGDDYLEGGGGNDDLDGATGNNTFKGGEGNDILSAYPAGSYFDIALYDGVFSNFSFAFRIDGSVSQVTDNIGNEGIDTLSNIERLVFSDGVFENGVFTPDTQPPPPNLPPIAHDDIFTGEQNVIVSGNVLVDNGFGADSDSDGGTLSVVAGTFSTAQSGSVQIFANGDFTYTSTLGFFGADSFEYTLEDGQGGSDSATVTLNIAEAPPPPEDAEPILYEAEDLLLAGYDIKSHGATSGGQYVEVQGLNGSTGTINLDFDGVDGLYALNINYFDETDGDATYSLRLNGAEIHSWVADTAEGSRFLAESSKRTETIRNIDLENGDNLELFATRVDGDAAKVDSFYFEPDDGDTNLDPIAVDKHLSSESFAAPTSLSVLVDPNTGLPVDSDPDGDTLSVVAETVQSLRGFDVTIGSDGFAQISNNGYVGSDRFTYSITDGNGGAASATYYLNTYSAEAVAFTLEAENLEIVSGGAIKTHRLASDSSFVEGTSALFPTILNVIENFETAELLSDGGSYGYDITFNYFDESDGVALYSLQKNGLEIASWSADRNDGNAAWIAPSTQSDFTVENVSLALGDDLTLFIQRESGDYGRIDNIDFTRSDITIIEPSVFEYEAESLALSGAYRIGNDSDASGGQLAELFPSTSTGAISVEWIEGSGVFDLKVDYFDENDGAPVYVVKVNGAEVGGWVADQDFGTAYATAASLTSETLPDIALSTGDILTIEVVGAAGEPARVDKLTFSGELTLVVESAAALDAADIIDLSAQSALQDALSGFIEGTSHIESAPAPQAHALVQTMLSLADLSEDGSGVSTDGFII